MGASGSRPIVFTDEVSLDHFKLLRVVGKGAFGKVRIVERKDTGLTFALKYIRKDEVVRSENVRNIIKERRMLERLNHPFLCNLRYSFQDFEYMYLVVDLMTGGDLRFHISRKAFSEEAIRFWISELACALRYIHGQGVVHRDVKPDNVLLDFEGHVHLADFNVATELRANKLLTSKSGTLSYLAPEVYDGKGYNQACDWWSLGVLFYECIYNKRPFEGNSHAELAARIQLASPKYPHTEPQVSFQCLKAMQALMEIRVAERIGANGFETFTDHPFFRDLDFELLEHKRIPPVFRPSSVKTNFDATYDLEELLLEEAPLEARARHQRPRAPPKADATPQERRAAELYRTIEQLFEPFNYLEANFKPVENQSSTATGETQNSHSGSANRQGEQPAKANTDIHDQCDRNESTSDTPALTSQVSVSSLKNTNTPAPPSSPPPPLPVNPSTSSNGNGDIEPYAIDSADFAAPAVNAPRSKSYGGPAMLHEQRRAREESLPTLPSAQPRPVKPKDTIPAEAKQKPKGKDGKGPSGVLGFLSRKKGREKSPRRGVVAENGVIGKEGARHVIG